MNDITQKLSKMKEQISMAETQVAQLEGRRDAAYEQLKKDFGFTTLAQAEKELIKMDEDLAKEEESLANEVKELEEACEWGEE